MTWRVRDVDDAPLDFGSRLVVVGCFIVLASCVALVAALAVAAWRLAL